MVRVFLQHGGETLLERVRSVEGGVMPATDPNIPAFACLDESGNPVGHFPLGQIAVIEIEDISTRTSHRATGGDGSP